MPKNGIGRRMAWWWYFVLVTINFIQAQNPFDGGGFLADPFLELTAGVTTPANQKPNKSDSSCISNGALAGSILATLFLSAFIGFLTWMVYLRQKLQDLQSYENQGKRHIRTLPQQHCPVLSPSKQNKRQHTNDDILDQKGNQLPLDVIDYKFCTYPFRQSQTPSVNGHYIPPDWLNRIPSSFRSATTDQDTQMVDIELLNPTFCGLNFSITGNMRAGIFIKEILDKKTSVGQIKFNSSDQLRTGDRIIALTVCFESIVYEDALTILSYASPYPVILRVQRPIHSTKTNVITETQSPPATTTNKVTWRDDFDHYDNDTPYNRSLAKADQSKTLTTELKSIPTVSHHHSSSKKTPTQSRSNKSSSTTKGNKIKTVSNTAETKATKRSNAAKKKQQTKPLDPIIFTSTGLSSKPIDIISTPPIPTNKTAKKSVTNAVISYLHYRGAHGGHATGRQRKWGHNNAYATNNSEATVTPYYDSPYDYYGAQISQSQLINDNNNNNNNNNDNSLSTESFTAVTSVYTLELSTTNSNSSTQRTILPRRCERRLSSPAVILPITVKKSEEKYFSLKNIDTFV